MESTADRKSPNVALAGTGANLRARLQQASLARKSSCCLARPLAFPRALSASALALAGRGVAVEAAAVLSWGSRESLWDSRHRADEETLTAGGSSFGPCHRQGRGEEPKLQASELEARWLGREIQTARELGEKGTIATAAGRRAEDRRLAGEGHARRRGRV